MKKQDYLDLNFTDKLADVQIDRRRFLKIFSGGIFIFITIGNTSVKAQEGTGNPWRPRMPEDFNAFLRIAENGFNVPESDATPERNSTRA